MRPTCWKCGLPNAVYVGDGCKRCGWKLPDPVEFQKIMNARYERDDTPEPDEIMPEVDFDPVVKTLFVLLAAALLTWIVAFATHPADNPEQTEEYVVPARVEK